MLAHILDIIARLLRDTHLSLKMCYQCDLHPDDTPTIPSTRSSLTSLHPRTTFEPIDASHGSPQHFSMTFTKESDGLRRENQVPMPKYVNALLRIVQLFPHTDSYPCRSILHLPNLVSDTFPSTPFHIQNLPSAPPVAHVQRDRSLSRQRVDAVHNFYHETIYPPSGNPAFMIFVASAWGHNSQYPLASSFSAFGIMTTSGRHLLLLQDYLGYQSTYNIFRVVTSYRSPNTSTIGLIAISREIPCKESKIPTTPIERTPYSIPHAVRTTVPKAYHTYAAAIFWDIPLSDCTLHEFPHPAVFEVD